VWKWQPWIYILGNKCVVPSMMTLYFCSQKPSNSVAWMEENWRLFLYNWTRSAQFILSQFQVNIPQYTPCDWLVSGWYLCMCSFLHWHFTKPFIIVHLEVVMHWTLQLLSWKQCMVINYFDSQIYDLNFVGYYGSLGYTGRPDVPTFRYFL